MRKKTPKMSKTEAKAATEALLENCSQEGVWLALCKCTGISGFRRYTFGEPKGTQDLMCPKCGNKEGIEWQLKRHVE